jgi:hypothetical protein
MAWHTSATSLEEGVSLSDVIAYAVSLMNRSMEPDEYMDAISTATLGFA